MIHQSVVKRSQTNHRVTSTLLGTYRLASAVLVLMAPMTLAQTSTQGFDLERLNPDIASPNSQVLSTGDGLNAGTVRVSLVLHYEKDPLVFYRNNERVGALVSDRLTAHLGAAWAPLDWLEVGLGLPVVLFQAGDDLSTQGMTALSGTALGAAVLQGRFTFLRQQRGAPVDVGLTLGLALPVGASAAYTKDSGSGLEFLPRVGVGRSFGLIRVGAEVGAAVRGTANLSPYAQSVKDQVGSLVIIGATVTTTNTGVRGELTARGLLPLSATSASVELLAGARYSFAKNFEVFALLGPGIGGLPGEAAFRVMGGLGWTPLAPVSCVEGQPYALADCPELDRDHDGVRNSQDTCPEQSGPVAGCPDGDDDADGVLNLADQCPKELGSARHQGCPVPDSDHDGVNDELDACPNEAGPNNGCADIDSDHDGVADRLDACPTLAGIDSTGCGEAAPAPAPEAAKVAVTDTHLELADKINFELGRAEIAANSFALLDGVASVLNAHPEIKNVRIEGHTDDSGPREFNVTLSQKRAEAVKAYLSQHGVDAARLEAKGFGPERPLASNLTAGGRERNRRVEFFTAH